MALRRAQAVAGLDLHLLGDPGAKILVNSFRPCWNATQSPLKQCTPRADLSGCRAMIKQVLLCGVNLCTAEPSLWLQPIFETHNPGGKSLPLMYQQQSRLTCNKKLHTAHMKGAPGAPNSGNQGGFTTGSYRILTIYDQSAEIEKCGSST